MSIAKIQETKNTIKAKGTLVGIDEDGFRIEDEKSGDIETLLFDDFEIFVGRSFTLAVADSLKKEITDEEE